MPDREDGQEGGDLAGAFAGLWTVLRFDGGLERPPEDRARLLQRVRDALDRGASRLSNEPDEFIAGTFRQEELVYEGESSLLWRLRHRDTGTAYGLKTLHPEAASDQWQRDMLLREAAIGERLCGPQFAAARMLIRLADGRPGLILPWGGASLAAAPNGELDVVGLSFQLLKGLTCLHGLGLVHSDLSAANLLQDTDGCLRIADFGLCLKVGERHCDFGFQEIGTRAFRAPELTVETPLSPAQDIYSAGVILEGLLASAPLSRLRLLIQQMTQKEPVRRPSAEQALEFIQEI